MRSIFDFHGRMDRRAFLVVIASSLVAVSPVIHFSSLLPESLAFYSSISGVSLVLFISAFAFLIALYALSAMVRRVHDIGQTAWLLLPIFGAFPLLGLLGAAFGAFRFFQAYQGRVGVNMNWLSIGGYMGDGANVGVLAACGILSVLLLLLMLTPGSQNGNRFDEPQTG